MPRRGTGIAFLAALLALSGGCLGGGSDGHADIAGPGRGEFTATTGAIVGTVVDDSLLPVERVDVSLLPAGLLVSTAADGTFAFSFVSPGPATFAVAKPGYEGRTIGVHVVAGEATEVLVQIQQEVSTRPFAKTVALGGLMSCYVAVRSQPPVGSYLSETFPCAPPEDEPRNFVPTLIDLGPLHNVTGVWSETTWSPAQSSAKGLKVAWYITYPGLTLNVQIVVISEGQSPVRVPIPAEHLIEMMELRNEDPCTWDACRIVIRHTTHANTLGNELADYGWMIDQRFDDYVTTFYNQVFPDDFTALPDE